MASSYGYSIPRNIPNFEDPRRRIEDSLWASSGKSRQVLPMYKDKPYNHPPSVRKRRSRRFYITIVVGALVVIYYMFFASGDSPGVREKAGKGLWEKWSGGSSKGGKAANWVARQAKVKEAMELSWSGYEKHAWGYDEYHPITKKGRMMVPPTGLGWMIVDSLDTLMLMNMTAPLTQAREWISSTLTYDLDHDVNTFETTIRLVGGLLSAHYLQTTFPEMCPVDLDKGGEDLYIEKATDLATRLMSAYDTDTGIPMSSVNLHQQLGIVSNDNGGAASLAEATSVQLEMKYLAKLTGEKQFWDAAEKVMEVVDRTTQGDGLKGIFVNTKTGLDTTRNVRLGSRGDSYYEYLIKQYLQTSKQEEVYKDMWEEAVGGIKKHLITYSAPSNFAILAERPQGLGNNIEPKMDHLVCFMPGTLALSTTGGISVAEAKKRGEWGTKQQENLDLAVELLKTCIGMYKVTATGLAPEITFFKLPESPHMYNDGPRTGPKFFDRHADAQWRDDFIIKSSDAHNLQRPETIESLFYLYRLTGDDYYREVGWEIFESFVKHTTTPEGDGFSSIGDVRKIPPPTKNNMESFWLAETLKYFYLLFGPTDILPLDQVVFNTEAHPFPRFEMGKLFWTGWKRLSSEQRHSEGVKAHEKISHWSGASKGSPAAAAVAAGAGIVVEGEAGSTDEVKAEAES